MKSKLTLCSLLAVSIAFMSCKKEEAEIEAATTTETQRPILEPNVTPIPTETYVQPNTAVQTPQTQPQTPAVAKAGMNPPHGQPGHRCDISVGAPLSSPVVKAATPATISGQPSSTTTVTAPSSQSGSTVLKNDTPAVTAPGMNPPHGQEGHKCEIAVGQPLPK